MFRNAALVVLLATAPAAALSPAIAAQNPTLLHCEARDSYTVSNAGLMVHSRVAGRWRDRWDSFVVDLQKVTVKRGRLEQQKVVAQKSRGELNVVLVDRGSTGRNGDLAKASTNSLRVWQVGVMPQPVFLLFAPGVVVSGTCETLEKTLISEAPSDGCFSFNEETFCE